MASAAAAPLPATGANPAIPMPPSSNLFAAGSVALVTGGNKGIGLEVVKSLAQKGITVLLGARDKGRGEEAVAKLHKEGLKTVEFQSIDVVSGDSIAAAVKAIDAKFGKLDILINNAGIIGELKWGSTIEDQKIDTFRTVYETNVYAPFETVKQFIPLLRKSAHPRVVNVSSGLASISHQRNPPSDIYKAVVSAYAYTSSKSAVNSVTVLQAADLARFSIKVNAADPGYCATDLNGNSGYRTPAQGAVVIVNLATLADDGPTGSFYSDDGAHPW